MSDPVHYVIVPFRAICGADAVGQATTTIPEHVTCQECFRAAQETIKNLNEVFERDIIPGIQAWMENVTQALNAVQADINRAVEAWLSSEPMRELIQKLYAAGVLPGGGSAYAAYAREYNWRHPNRKISWRRLNRTQRQDAIAKLNRRAL